MVVWLPASPEVKIYTKRGQALVRFGENAYGENYIFGLLVKFFSWGTSQNTGYLHIHYDRVILPDSGYCMLAKKQEFPSLI